MSDTVWIDPQTGAERYAGEPDCNGLCLTGYDILCPADGVSYAALSSVVYPHPECQLHGFADPWESEDRLLVACEAQRAALTLAYAEGRVDGYR